MRPSELKSLIVLLGVLSLAEVVRLTLYGMPFGPLLSVAWALFAAALLWRIAHLRADRWLKRFAWSLPLVVLLATVTAFFAAGRAQPALSALFFAAIFAIPLVTVAITALRLNPAVANRLRPIPLPASLVVMVLGLAAATPPAWEMVMMAPVGNVHLELAGAHAGCLEIAMSGWKPSMQPGHAIRSPGRYIRLDTAHGAEYVAGERSMGSVFERGKPIIRPGWIWGAAYWEPIDSDRIVLTYNTGMHGTRVVLRRRHGGYRGRAISWTDVIDGSPPPRATVSATPVSCDRVPPDSARMPGALRREMNRQDSLLARQR